MVNNWSPWGQRGNGAPNLDTRIRNLEMDGLYPVNKNVTRQSHTLPRAAGKATKYFCQGMTGISGGSGAPIRNESGRMLIPLHEDPSITFGDSTRNYVDKDLRYRTTPMEQNIYRQDLDRMVEEKKRLKFNERFKDNVEQVDPWGRPGPGGAPWRDPKAVGQNFLKSMGWTTKESLRSINNEMNDKSFPPQQQRSPPKYNTKQPMSCCDRCSCECIKKIENTILRSSSPPKAKENYRMNADVESVQKSPRKMPHYALPQQCNRHLEPLQSVPIMSSTNKPKFSPVKRPSMTNGGGVELAPLLSKRRDERPISLSSTDITKYKINKSSWHDGDPEYLSDLDRQVMQKQRLRQMSREREAETSRTHFQNFDSYWGRPGCGAPKSNKNKLKLDDLLYHTTIYQHYDQQY